MRSKTFSGIAVIALFASQTIPMQLSAQEQKRHKQEHRRYKLVDIGTFGGPESNINPVGNGSPYINKNGAAVGTSATAVPSEPTVNGFVCGGLDGTVPFRLSSMPLVGRTSK